MRCHVPDEIRPRLAFGSRVVVDSTLTFSPRVPNPPFAKEHQQTYPRNRDACERRRRTNRVADGGFRDLALAPLERILQSRAAGAELAKPPLDRVTPLVESLQVMDERVERCAVAQRARDPPPETRGQRVVGGFRQRRVHPLALNVDALLGRRQDRRRPVARLWLQRRKACVELLHDSRLTPPRIRLQGQPRRALSRADGFELSDEIVDQLPMTLTNKRDRHEPPAIIIAPTRCASA